MGARAGGVGASSLYGGAKYVERIGVKVSLSSLGKIQGTQESYKKANTEKYFAQQAYKKAMYAKQSAQSKLYSAKSSGSASKIKSAQEAYDNAVGEYNKTLKAATKAEAKANAEWRKWYNSQKKK